MVSVCKQKKTRSCQHSFFLPVVDVVAAVVALIQLAFGLCSSFVEQA